MHSRLAAGDEFFRVAVDLSPSGMFVVDALGTITLVNREVERLFGYPREELIGTSVDLLVPLRFRSGHAAFRAGFFAAPLSRPMGAGRDLYGLRRDGTEFPVEIGLNPVETSLGLVTLASVVDITLRRESERLLRESEERTRQSQKLEALGTLAGGIAHDFNNLLLAIVGHTELVQRGGALTPAQHEDLEQILQGADRGRQLVQRILTFSRSREVARVPVDLRKVVREAMKLLRASLPSTIEMLEFTDPAVPAVLSDETQIHQILMNLATNSAHALERGGLLEIRLEPFEVDADFAKSHPPLQPGPHACLSVTDNGVGMPAEVQARVFEPFFTTRAADRGTGLGMSVIHGIVSAHAGAIDVESRSGEGTRVHIYFPALSGTVPESSTTPIEPVVVNTPHVLFVDDEVALGRMQKRLLESMGYRVTLHASSLSALEEFRANPEQFDVLVTDNTMPRMTGVALAQEIRRIRPGLPVLMVSGITEHVDPETLAEFGIRATLQKPHTSAELDTAIRTVLAPN